ncbi:MAG: oligosaccharide flippase family protein, partial [Chloroflexi bacterium]|nr:oligosaccharide flippase family protein [Chloroflexota bacterium]
VLSYVPVVSLALAGAGYLSLLAQPVTAGLLGLVPAWLSVRALLPDVFRLRWQFDRQTARDLIGFGLPLGASGFATSIVERFDNFLIGTFVGTTTLGFYDRAYRLARWPTLLVTDVVNRGVVATYARLQDDRERLAKTVKMTIWVITTGALPVVIGLFVAGQDLVVWLFGERWLPSVPFLRILLAFAVILPIIDAAHWLLVAIGRSGQAAAVRIIQAVALVVTGFALTLPFGAVGTAAAVGIAYVVGLAMTLRFVSREVPVNPIAWFGGPLVAAGLTVGAYLLLARTIDLNQVPLWARVFLKPSLAGAIYLLLLVALQPRTTIERGRYVLRLARGAG